jgi:hypothetical protein
VQREERFLQDFLEGLPNEEKAPNQALSPHLKIHLNEKPGKYGGKARQIVYFLLRLAGLIPPSLTPSRRFW